MKKENAGNRGSGVSGSRRTRSQIAVAPGWTAADCLVLVNVIAAVEADCLKALSSYQKWKIVAENCTSLDVVRTSNQCRRKWDCLLIEHDVIKQWELKMPDDDSYWRLASGRRKELGLPENFDEELFKAIDNVASMRANQSDTESDTDPEAAIENANEIAEPGMVLYFPQCLEIKFSYEFVLSILSLNTLGTNHSFTFGLVVNKGRGSIKSLEGMSSKSW